MTFHLKETIHKASDATYGKNYDAKGAARRLKLAEQTLSNWRHLRRGPAYIRIGSRIIYREADLADFEAKNRIDPEVRS